MARNDLKGKLVLIAGGGKNHGGLLSIDFAAKGAKLAIHYNSESAKAESEKTLSEVQGLGDEAFLFQALATSRHFFIR
nr:hypothetical protein [Pedobacter sp. ASV19]